MKDLQTVRNEIKHTAFSYIVNVCLENPQNLWVQLLELVSLENFTE